MNTLTKLALGLIGRLEALPPVGDALPLRELPSPSLSGGMPLMSALARRQSQREFAPEPLAEQMSAMGLQADHQLLLSQTVGATKPALAV